jgi:sugar lactone lactonase YvrE
MVRTLEAAPVFEDRAELGECPVWDEKESVLWWIDWSQGVVYRSDVAGEVSTLFRVGPSLAALTTAPHGHIALALGHGFADLDPATGRVSASGRAEPDDMATRMCDGKCDVSGRFWAGTMALDERSPIGALFVMEADDRVRRALDGVVVSNGLCWSIDNTRLYYIDTATCRIDVFDFDLAHGTIANRRPLVEIDANEGSPDGLTIDAEGYLWVALWDGWQVRRYSPTGGLDTVIELPIARPTCCALGGADFRDLFITTAAPDSADERETQALAGRVFRARVDVAGLPAHRCGYAVP